MTATFVHQPGPLVWVKPEIDFALDRADASLEEYFDNPQQNTPALTAAATSLREITGALQIIGMEALARFSREIEELLNSLVQHSVEPTSTCKELIARATTILAQYLADLVSGEQERAMTLLPLMGELARARGLEATVERNFFWVNLEAFPPPHPHGEALAGAPLSSLVRSQRSNYQRGVLTWLRGSEDGLDAMLNAIQQIERVQPDPKNRAPWWVMAAFFDGLIHRGMHNTDETKRLAGRVDRHLADFASGTGGSEALIRELLFQLARCEPVTPLVHDVQSLYRLGRYAPSKASGGDAPADAVNIDTALQETSSLLLAAKREWAGFLSGESDTLVGFRKCIADLEHQTVALRSDSLGDVLAMLHGAALKLRSGDPDRNNEPLAGEIGSALLAVEWGLQDSKASGRHAVGSFAAVGDRLRSVLEHKPSQSTGDDTRSEPRMESVEDQNAVSHVSREMLADLYQVEQALDAHFRGQVDASAIPPLTPLMRNVAGALFMLGQDTAACVIEGCNSIVSRLGEVSEEESALLVDGLSSVMLYVQATEHGNGEELRAVETVLAHFKEKTFCTTATQSESQANTTVVQDVQPEASKGTGSEDLSPNCTLVDEASRSKGVINEEFSEILDHLDLKALQDTVSISGDSDAHAPEISAKETNVDPEIVEIFLEEAKEILTAMVDHIAELKTEPHDQGTLGALRRGFHTLKGSGRMAGLSGIGDAAWTIESLLNSWLEAEQPASANLIALLELSRGLFSGWLANVPQRGCTPDGIDELEGRAKEVAGELAAPSENEQPALPPVIDIPRIKVGELSVESVTIGSLTLPISLFQVFLDEARQNLSVLETSLSTIGLETVEEDREAFRRAAHTLGGISRAAGFLDIGFVAGVIEDVPLARMADCAKATDLLTKAVGSLTSLVENVASKVMPELSVEERTALSEGAELLRHAPKDNVEPLAESATTTNIGSATAHPAPFPKALTDSENSGSSPSHEACPSPSASSCVETFQTEQVSSEANVQERERRVVRDDIDEQLLPIFLEEVRDLVPLVGEDLRHLRTASADTSASDSLRRILHTIKGAARMVGAMRLGELVHVMEGQLEAASDAGFLGLGTLDALEVEFDRLTRGLDALEERASGEKPARPDDGVLDSTAATTPEAIERQTDAPPSFAAQIRVAQETLDRLINHAGEIAIARGRIDLEVQSLRQFLRELTDSILRLRGQLREVEIQAESRLQATLKQVNDQESAFDPLEFDRFTRFQELTRQMAESLHDVTTVQTNLMESLDEVHAALNDQSRLTRGLQHDLMQLRTVSFTNVGERLYRVVRQAARETSKQVKFEVVGEQTEVDRSVLERMTAPLEHLVRNAVVHGIEAPDYRVRLGKSEAGTIKLTLRQEANNLLISLSDDGKGIDYDRIRVKAVERGWISDNARPTDVELQEMILRAGFSTASEVTELAGRGVGMDVVANEIRTLGGRLEIETAVGMGTTFRLRVPITVAVANAVVVSAAGRRWAILSGLVEQVQEVSVDAFAKLTATPEVNWMGYRYPLFYLPRLLDEDTAPPVDRPKYFSLLTRSGDRRAGVIVEQLAVNQDVVLKKLGPQLGHLRGLIGATVLPDGEIALILNPPVLADEAKIRHDGNFSKLREMPPAVSPLVMIVDDSLTVRKVTTRMLTRNEFRVFTARDGLDALQQIQETIPDVLLVDIEMPRMDGFDLTKSLKASPRTANIPIIMITSRLAAKHREYAQKLGVDTYLGKPYEEKELLAHIAKFAVPPKAA